MKTQIRKQLPWLFIVLGLLLIVTTLSSVLALADNENKAELEEITEAEQLLSEAEGTVLEEDEAVLTGL